MTFLTNNPRPAELASKGATAAEEDVNLSKKSQLLQSAKSGDREALESLLAEEAPSIYRFGMRMCRHEQDAEDILQETMLAASRSLADFREDSSLSTWLYTIARRFCIKKRRQGKFTPRRIESLEAHFSEAEQLVHPGKSPDETAQSRELRTALEAAVAKLEPEHREVILLRDVEGLTANEVATILGLSVVAVKSRLHRARLCLRETLVPLLDDPIVVKGPGCPEVISLYSQKLEDELSAEVCADIEEHLKRCGACQATCDSLKKTLHLCGSYPKSPIPESVQLKVKTALREFALSGSSQQ